MKMRFFTLAMACVTVQILMAQGLKGYSSEKAEEMRTDKVAFITQRVGFTADEAALFWIHYNEFEDEMKELNKAERKAKQSLTENSSEADYANVLKVMADTEKKAYDLKTKYFAKYKKILSSQKLYLYYMAEKDYRRFLLDKITKKNNSLVKKGRPTCQKECK